MVAPRLFPQEPASSEKRPPGSERQVSVSLDHPRLLILRRRSARQARRKLPGDKSEIANIDYAVVIHIRPGIEARLAGSLTERRFHDRQIGAIHDAIATEIAWYAACGNQSHDSRKRCDTAECRIQTIRADGARDKATRHTHGRDQVPIEGIDTVQSQSRTGDPRVYQGDHYAQTRRRQQAGWMRIQIDIHKSRAKGAETARNRYGQRRLKHVDADIRTLG